MDERPRRTGPEQVLSAGSPSIEHAQDSLFSKRAAAKLQSGNVGMS